MKHKNRITPRTTGPAAEPGIQNPDRNSSAQALKSKIENQNSKIPCLIDPAPRPALPAMHTVQDAIDVCEREKSNFFLSVFMFQGCVYQLNLDCIAQLAEQPDPARRRFQTGQARQAFAKLIGGASDHVQKECLLASDLSPVPTAPTLMNYCDSVLSLRHDSLQKNSLRRDIPALDVARKLAIPRAEANAPTSGSKGF